MKKFGAILLTVLLSLSACFALFACSACDGDGPDPNLPDTPVVYDLKQLTVGTKIFDIATMAETLTAEEKAAYDAVIAAYGDKVSVKKKDKMIEFSGSLLLSFGEVGYTISGSEVTLKKAAAAVVLKKVTMTDKVFSFEATADGVTYKFAYGDPVKLPPEPLIPVIINQIFGRGFNKDTEEGGNRVAAVSHSFVELYNKGDATADLAGYSLYCGANGITSGVPWSFWNGQLKLSKKIPAKSSLLVVVSSGTAATDANPLVTSNPDLVFAEDQIDLKWNKADFDKDNIGFSNKNLKVCLMKGTAPLTVTNPFDTDGNGKRAEGYVDLMSVTGNNSTIPVDAFEYKVNASANEKKLREAEGADKPQAVQSKQKAVRRKNFSDTDDTFGDTRIIDYRVRNLSKEGFERYRPRSLKDAAWGSTNIDDRASSLDHVIINQIYGKGRREGRESPFSNSFIELYNPTGQNIPLKGWSIQAAQGAAADDPDAGKAWIKLDFKDDDVIPANHSFLIMMFGARTDTAPYVFDNSDSFDTAGGTQKQIFYDQIWFAEGEYLWNKNLKVALMKNTTLLTVKNPFDTNGSGAMAEGLVDLLGITGNDADTPMIDGCETETYPFSNGQSRQRAVRRVFFSDTDVNLDDVEVIDFRDEGTEVYLPRCTKKSGSWGFYVV
ncbi:MAG: lamin tail domain-containing protein [Firmicutes bacterium]|nr:lamin tail domain-containing protein [Bacillota bacterium]